MPSTSLNDKLSSLKEFNNNRFIYHQRPILLGEFFYIGDSK